jgi:uncharacterized membrane protein
MNRKYTIIMVLSFIYGGFLLTTYALTMYSVLMKEDVPGPFAFLVDQRVSGQRDLRFSQNEQNLSLNVSSAQETFNETTRRVNGTFPRAATFQRSIDPMEALSSPFMLFALFGGIICISNGLAVRQLTHEKEIKKARAELTELLLNPEEKLVISELQKAGGELTQKNLTDLTGYSRVKTHRIIQRLETKKIVRKIPNGQTNKIMLEEGKNTQKTE